MSDPIDLLALAPEPWRPYLDDRALRAAGDFLTRERAQGRAFQPDEQSIFRALELTPPDRVRAIITAQDPYPGAGVPTGLAFSVPAGAPLPASLRNIFREYQDDLGLPAPASGDLSAWARNGVLLLNASLTCEVGRAGSHARGWQAMTGALLARLAVEQRGLAFVCWGRHARALIAGLTLDNHRVIESPHPSPLSSYRGWFGSRPFSRCNAALVEMGRSPIDWALPLSAAPVS